MGVGVLSVLGTSLKRSLVFVNIEQALLPPAKVHFITPTIDDIGAKLAAFQTSHNFKPIALGFCEETCLQILFPTSTVTVTVQRNESSEKKQETKPKLSL